MRCEGEMGTRKRERGRNGGWRKSGSVKVRGKERCEGEGEREGGTRGGGRVYKSVKERGKERCEGEGEGKKEGRRVEEVPAKKDYVRRRRFKGVAVLADPLSPVSVALHSREEG